MVRLIFSIMAVVCLGQYAGGHEMAPVQVEWTVDDQTVIWMDCWPSDGQTQSAVWVYLVYQDGTAPYVCTVNAPLHIAPAPVRSDTIKAVF